MQDRENQADLAVTLLHEFADALLHFDVDDGTERAKREVEAEAVAYIVGQYCGLDTSGSVFYLAGWNSDDTEVIRNRLERISRTTEEIIGVSMDWVYSSNELIQTRNRPFGFPRPSELVA